MELQPRASASKPQKGPSPDNGHTPFVSYAFQPSRPTNPPCYRYGAGHFRLLSNVPYELSATKLDQSPVEATTSGVDMKTCLSCHKGRRCAEGGKEAGTVTAMTLNPLPSQR